MQQTTSTREHRIVTTASWGVVEVEEVEEVVKVVEEVVVLHLHCHPLHEPKCLSHNSIHYISCDRTHHRTRHCLVDTSDGPSPTILTKSLRVDWDLTVSMSVFTARQIHHATP